MTYKLIFGTFCLMLQSVLLLSVIINVDILSEKRHIKTNVIMFTAQDNCLDFCTDKHSKPTKIVDEMDKLILGCFNVSVIHRVETTGKLVRIQSLVSVLD